MSPQLPSQATSTSLLIRVKSRDSEAWERFAKLYGPLVYQWARRANLQESDAADLVQEVFSAVADSIDRFRRENEGTSFRGWLWGITRNKLREYIRRKQAEPQGAGGSEAKWQIEQVPLEMPRDDQENAGMEVAGSLAHRALQLIKTDFAEQTWEAFWRAAILRQRAKEISQALGMSVGAVYTAKSRVLTHLRRELEGLD